MMLSTSIHNARSVLTTSAVHGVNVQAKRFATLKDIAARIKSVKSIQKITKSMKMVSAAKFARADRDLKNAAALVNAVTKHSIFSKIDSEKKVSGAEEVSGDDGSRVARAKPIVVTVSGDRGLCGGIHSNVSKYTRTVLKAYPTASLVVLGDKARSLLARTDADKLTMHVSDVNKKVPSFTTASIVANSLIMHNKGLSFPSGFLVYNHFKSAISYSQVKIPIFSADYLSSSEEFALYETEDTSFQDYQEFTLAATVYAGLVQAAASEQSARMQAMENSSKNASEMIEKLSAVYNRTRQAVITNELIEIISGASAV